jgi:ABC-2 type transport system permease protein/sodium transport system permease protein
MLGRLQRLVLKELREILRDRRTIITLVVMPLLIYPLLGVAFQRFLLTSISAPTEVSYLIGVDSEVAQHALLRQLAEGSAELAKAAGSSEAPKPGQGAKGADASAESAQQLISRLMGGRQATPELSIIVLPGVDMEKQVDNSFIHLAAIQKRAADNEAAQGLRMPLKWELVYRSGSPPSEAALHFVESRLEAYNEAELNRQLEALGVEVSLTGATSRKSISYTSTPPYALLIPLILVLMTVTGAVYPAIDLTAGERERGTLETLIAAPVPRFGLLMAKYFAVLTVAMLTAIVNLVAMTITVHSTGLATQLFGSGLSFVVILKVLMLLVLFAAFFSAILLAVTSYARSFKEAQAYIIPLMLLCLVPGVLCLLPTLEFKGWMAVTPLVNIVMLAREMLENNVQTSLAAAAVGSTIFYIVAAIAVAARIFGTDAILYGSQTTWSDFVRRPTEPQPTATFPGAMLCLALMFPSYFVASGLVRSPEMSMDQQLMVCALITMAVCGGIPTINVLFNRVRADSGLGFRRASVLQFVAAAILGLSVWPFALEVFLLSDWLGLSMLGKQQIALAEALLEQIPTAPMWLVLLTLGLIPAVVEEFCFRGFLFGALRTTLSGVATVFASAIVFGVFHELLLPGRMLTSTFLGLVLGWVRFRTGSVLPGMLLHALHNCLLLSVIYNRPVFERWGWGKEAHEHLPITWLLASVVAIGVAAAMLVAATRRRGEASSDC